MKDRARRIQRFIIQPFWRVALDFAGQNRTKTPPKLRTTALSIDSANRLKNLYLCDFRGNLLLRMGGDPNGIYLLLMNPVTVYFDLHIKNIEIHLYLQNRSSIRKSERAPGAGPPRNSVPHQGKRRASKYVRFERRSDRWVSEPELPIASSHPVPAWVSVEGFSLRRTAHRNGTAGRTVQLLMNILNGHGDGAI